jgi:hypothetical protein
MSFLSPGLCAEKPHFCSHSGKERWSSPGVVGIRFTLENQANGNSPTTRLFLKTKKLVILSSGCQSTIVQKVLKFGLVCGVFWLFD